MTANSFLRPCHFLLATALFLPTLAVGQIIQQPQDAVLLLKHGTTLCGYVTPAGDSYIVLFGESGEARVPTKDVVAVLPDLQAAYQYKRGQLDGSMMAHLELSNWCLQHKLPERAADQLLVAEQRFGKHPQVESFHRRLVSLAKPVSAADVIQAAVAQVNFEQDQTVVSATAIDSFTSSVQPLLLNRCAAGGCHNMRGTSEFVLMRPFLGQATTRRMTERNLKAALAHVDRDQPMSSKLLQKASVAHGGSVVAAISDREQLQLEAISNWLQSLAPSSVTSQPDVISPANELLYQPKKIRSSDNSSPAPQPKPGEAIRSQGQVTQQAGDPFDPAIFNRRHHSAGQ